MSTESATVPRIAGWRVVAAKGLSDHLLSGRFIVLMAVLGIATAAAVFAASGGIRDIAPNAQGITALFLKLFTVTTDPCPSPSSSSSGFSPRSSGSCSASTP